MRTRKEIENDMGKYHNWTSTDIIELQIKLNTEVLLDIRDLLANAPQAEK